MASQEPVKGEEEEMVAAERELADDAMWKIIQKNTFTRWANEHLKTVKLSINDLERDLSDGLKLIGLIEVLSGKKFLKYNKRPSFRTQKFENVTVSLRFLEESEGIKIVNIDSSDIVDQKLKLIMGLIWTLILHYSISMPVWEGEDPAADKDRTPKQRLLAWIQSKIPEKNITNFTTDWNDGTAIAALVEALAPGLCPDWPEMNPKNAVPNAKQAMDMAEKWMDVPQLIKPDEMTNPKVDELSMMTYLSRFPNAHLKPGAPLQIKTNPARVRAYGPGLEATGNVVGAPARFTVETFGAGKGDVEVVVLNPKGVAEKCQIVANNDRLLSYTCVYTPTVEGQYKVTIKFASKDIPKCPYVVTVGKPGDSKKVVVQGPGVEKIGVQANRKTYFEVITKGCGTGVVDVGIVDPQGAKNTVRAVITKKTDDMWYVEYTALVAGAHSVNIFFAGKAAAKSPYIVGVGQEGAAPMDASKLPKPETCTPLEAALATLATPLKAAPGASPAAPAAAPSDGPGAKEKPTNAAAQKPGQAPAAATPAAATPAAATPAAAAPAAATPAAAKPGPPNAKACYARGRGVQPKGLRVGDEADIKIYTEGAGGANVEPRVMVMGPGGITEKLVKPVAKVNGYYSCMYKPSKPGMYIVNITYSGQQIQKSPMKVDVAVMKLMSKIKAHGPGLETGVVGQPAKFTVEQNGEPGQLGLRVEGPSQARLEPKKNPDGTMDVAYYPTEPGEYAVHVLCNNEDIPKSPFMADIKPATDGFDPSKVEAYGPGLQPSGVTVNSVAEFTVDVSKAGTLPAGELPKVAVVDAASAAVKVEVVDNKNSTFTCRYTPTKTVQHTVTVTYAGTAVQNSPFKVSVEGGANPAKVKVYGPAIEQPVKTYQSTYIIIDCKEAGVGETKVTLTNEKGVAVPFKLIDNKDKTYRVEFEATVTGLYTSTVTFANQPTPGSPYKIKVETSVDISKVQVRGLPESVPVGQEVAFEISTAAAGKGQAKVNITNPKGQNVPCFVAEKPDGFNAKFTPKETGPHTVQVTFADLAVPNSPFKVSATEPSNPAKVKVFGPALDAPVQVHHVTHLIVDCKEAGPGSPHITLTNQQGLTVMTKIIDNKDHTYRVEFEAAAAGEYTANVTFANQQVPKSPFKINIASGIDASKVQVKGLPENAPVGKEVPFEIGTAEAGKGQARVNVTSPKGQNIPCAVVEKPDGFSAKFTPTEAGPHTVQVTFADQPVPHSPFKVNATEESPVSKVKVYGPALEAPVTAYTSTHLTVDCKEAGQGVVQATLSDANGTNVPVRITDNKNQTHRVEFEATVAGTYTANVTFANQQVPNSPFKVNVVPSTADVSKVQVKELPQSVPVSQQVAFTIDTADAGPVKPELKVSGPSGSPVPSTVEPKPAGERPGFTGKFTPVETGPHAVEVKCLDQQVPGSPFQTNAVGAPAGPASKVKVYGSGLTSGTVSKPADFTIDTREAGPGALGLTIDGPTEAKIECFDKGGGLFDVRYWPTEPGQYTTNILFDEQPVPGSPFKAQINPSKMVDVSGIKVHGQGIQSTGVFAQSTTDFTVDATSVETKGEGVVKALITSPTGSLTEANVNNKKNGVYECLYTPFEQGPHNIAVTYDGLPVPGSPFTAGVVPGCDPSRVQVYGPGLKAGQVNVPQKFTIKTRGAGPGGVGLSVVGPTEPKVGCVDNHDGTLTVEYLASSVGQYEIGVTFADQPVTGSPFHANITEHAPTDSPASEVRCYGAGVEPKGPTRGQPATFTVDATKAPVQATPEVNVTDLTSGQTKPAQLTPRGPGLFDVSYTPDTQGPSRVDVNYAGQPVPNSPFNVDVQPGTSGPDASKVVVSGSGIKPNGVPASLPVTFNVDTRAAGTAAVEATVKDSRGRLLKAEVKKIDEATYAVSYTPEEVGPHTVSVKFAGQEVPSGPFTVNTEASGNASLVQFTETVKQSIAVNQESSITVRKSEAGAGQVTCDVTSSTSGVQVAAKVTDNNDGTATIKYKPTQTGPHTVDVKFGGVTIPNGHLTQEVTGDTPGEVVEEELLPSQAKKDHSAWTPRPDWTEAPTEAKPQEVEDELLFAAAVDKVESQQQEKTQAATETLAEIVEEEMTVTKQDKAHAAAEKWDKWDQPTQQTQPEKAPEGSEPGEIVEEPMQAVKAKKDHSEWVRPDWTDAPVEAAPQAVEDEPLFAAVAETAHSQQQQKTEVETQQLAVVTEEQMSVTKTERAHTVNETWAQWDKPESQAPTQSSLGVELAPTPPEPSPFHAADFNVPIGPDFNQVSAVVTTPSLKKYQPKVVDNKNGSVKVNYHPLEAGPHTLEVNYAGVPLAGSPYKFNAQPITPGKVSVHGPGLSSGLVGQPASFTVVTKEAGPGGLGVAIEGPSKVEIQPKDNKDGTVTITYTPTLPGEYKIVVKWAGQIIDGAPYFARISAPFGEEQNKSQMSLGTQGSLALTVTETDLTNLTATIRRPSGVEEPCGLRRQPSGQLGISFTPRETGDHLVSVFRNGQPIAGSPFKVLVGCNEIGDASKVRVGGRGLMQAVTTEQNEFFINTRDAGIGSLAMSMEGPGKVDFKCFENPGGACRVAYKPVEPGTYQLTIKYADEHIPGSPFTVNVGGQPSGRVTEKITRQQQALTQTTSIGTQCELNINLADVVQYRAFLVNNHGVVWLWCGAVDRSSDAAAAAAAGNNSCSDTAGIDINSLEGSITSPSGTTERCDVIDLGNGRFTVKFVPKEMGVHAVSLKTNGLHLPGSPFQFTVGPIAGGGPHKVRAVGPGLERGEVNKPNQFTIITREAGPGGLSIGIEGPSKAVIDFQDRQNGTSDVTYNVTEPGEYVITVKYNDQLIPDSPFKVYILPSAGDSKKLQVHNLQQVGVQANTSSQFTVDFNGVQGRLEAKVVAPSGAETEALVQQIQNDRCSVNFVPRESGTHYVHVRLNGVHIPGSPYPVQVGQVDADASRVRAYGDGLYKGLTGQLCKFTVDTSNTGSGPLSVSISGPSKVELVSREVSNGYEFSYTPLAPGDYLITIKYAGNTHVPGSPFKARIDGTGQPASMFAESRMVIETVKKSTTTTVQSVQQQQQQVAVEASVAATDAKKVQATGAGLQKAFVNQECSFIIDGSQTAYNMLVIGIAGPQVPCEQLHAIHMGRLKYIVKYTLSQPGSYQLIVKWGEHHIPGSPFNIVAQ